jgi:hypothetical protein
MVRDHPYVVLKALRLKSPPKNRQNKNKHSKTGLDFKKIIIKPLDFKKNQKPPLDGTPDSMHIILVSTQ